MKVEIDKKTRWVLALMCIALLLWASVSEAENW